MSDASQPEPVVNYLLTGTQAALDDAVRAIVKAHVVGIVGTRIGDDEQLARRAVLFLLASNPAALAPLASWMADLARQRAIREGLGGQKP